MISINGVSMDGASHSLAISLLRDSGNMVDLLVKRRVYVPSPHKRLQKTVTLEKNKSTSGIYFILSALIPLLNLDM